jgi:hypothetical protein
MRHRRNIPWVPLGSFALALLISMVGSSPTRALGRAAGGTTACQHTFTKDIPGEKCVDSETNHITDNPPVCVDAAPPSGTKWYTHITGKDAQYLVSIVASGAANNGANLGPTSEGLVDASKTLSGTMPCTPCHDISASAVGTATAVVRMGHPKLPFDFTIASCISTVNVTRNSDCGGPNDTKSAVAYTVVFRFVRPGLDPGEHELGYYLTGSPGALVIENAEPVNNNPDQYACRGIASLSTAFGSIAKDASVTFHGHSQIISVRAPFNNGQGGDSGAQAAGRLGDLSLVDIKDVIGD